RRAGASSAQSGGGLPRGRSGRAPVRPCTHDRSGANNLPAMRSPVLASLLVAAALLVACGGGDESGETTTVAGEEAACEEASRPQAKEVDVARPPKRPSAARLVAVVETTCG